MRERRGKGREARARQEGLPPTSGAARARTSGSTRALLMRHGLQDCILLVACENKNLPCHQTLPAKRTSLQGQQKYR